MKVAFLCSGGGGNLRFVHHAVRSGWLDTLQICAVFSDRECGANAYARAQGLPTEVLDFDGGQRSVLMRLQSVSPDLVVTTVHKILTNDIVQAFRGHLVNLHYALLPAFGAKIGDRPVRAALEYGARFVGITVHFVDEGVDTGRPILQAVTDAAPGADLATLMNVLFRAGCVGLLNSLSALASPTAQGSTSSIRLGGQVVHFNPPVSMAASLEQDAGWEFLR